MLSAPLLLGLAFFPDLDVAPKHNAWVQDHGIWIHNQAGDRRVVYDALAAEPVAASPEGDRVVYAQLNPLFDAPHCGNTPKKFLVLVKVNGEQLWRVGFGDLPGLSTV